MCNIDLRKKKNTNRTNSHRHLWGPLDQMEVFIRDLLHLLGWACAAPEGRFLLILVFTPEKALL